MLYVIIYTAMFLFSYDSLCRIKCQDFAAMSEISRKYSLSLAVKVTYLDPLVRWEHGPSTKTLHCVILLCAICIISLQVWPIFFSSVSTSRRQAFLGRPPFRFPWGGVHVNDCLVMLVGGFRNASPIHIHFFCLIYLLEAVHFPNHVVDSVCPLQCLLCHSLCLRNVRQRRHLAFELIIIRLVFHLIFCTK